MIKVMVADDSIEQNSIYCNYLTKDEEVEIISSTYDGENTIKDYLVYKPDVLILDLNMPKLSGIDVINNLSMYSDEKKKCNIIVVSGFADMRLKLGNVSKIYRIVSKPCNLNEVLSTVKEIGTDKPILNEKEIKELLIKLKFNLYTKGMPYLIDAIDIAFKEPNLLYNISNLYSIVGFKNNVKKEKIQRSIRGTIDIMNNHIPTGLLCSFFHTTASEKISPKYFFEVVIEYFKAKK